MQNNSNICLNCRWLLTQSSWKGISNPYDIDYSDGDYQWTFRCLIRSDSFVYDDKGSNVKSDYETLREESNIAEVKDCEYFDNSDVPIEISYGSMREDIAFNANRDLETASLLAFLFEALLDLESSSAVSLKSLMNLKEVYDISAITIDDIRKQIKNQGEIVNERQEMGD